MAAWGLAGIGPHRDRLSYSRFAFQASLHSLRPSGLAITSTLLVGCRLCFCSQRFGGVFEGAQLSDFDLDAVFRLEAEVVGWDETGSGEEDDAVGEALVGEQVLDEVFEGAFEVIEGGFPGECDGIAAGDGHANGLLADEVFAPTRDDPGAESAGGVEHFGLGEVEQVFAFDIASTDIVTDGAADDSGFGIDDQGEFRFGDRPFGVRADADLAAGSHDLFREGFEEELRAWGIVDAVVG